MLIIGVGLRVDHCRVSAFAELLKLHNTPSLRHMCLTRDLSSVGYENQALLTARRPTISVVSTTGQLESGPVDPELQGPSNYEKKIHLSLD